MRRYFGRHVIRITERSATLLFGSVDSFVIVARSLFIINLLLATNEGYKFQSRFQSRFGFPSDLCMMKIEQLFYKSNI